jgi:hypothetical protein
MLSMPKASHGTTERANGRITPREKALLRHMAKDLGVTENAALRWAITFAYQHEHGTSCERNSSCRQASMSVLGQPATKQARAAGTTSDEATDGEDND